MVTHYTVHVFIWGVFTADWWMVAIDSSYCVNFLVLSCLGDKHIDIFFHVLFIFHNQISKVFRTNIKCTVVSLFYLLKDFLSFVEHFFFMDFTVEMIHKIMFIKVRKCDINSVCWYVYPLKWYFYWICWKVLPTNINETSVL